MNTKTVYIVQTKEYPENPPDKAWSDYFEHDNIDSAMEQASRLQMDYPYLTRVVKRKIEEEVVYE
jgi:DNA-binding MarR family transcriptional regulator